MNEETVYFIKLDGIFDTESISKAREKLEHELGKRVFVTDSTMTITSVPVDKKIERLIKDLYSALWLEYLEYTDNGLPFLSGEHNDTLTEFIDRAAKIGVKVA